ncbi:MAG: hypothetical protein VXV97_14780, partial [Pseudomonadota bacterium]|nr:hypothetical protein [Pseudomonadota bacterium]
LMQPSLEAAIRTAYRSDAVVEILGVPTCAIPGFDDLHGAYFRSIYRRLYLHHAKFFPLHG